MTVCGKLRIGKVNESKWFELPLETVTSTLAILAIRGAGKTYAASVLAEELLRTGQQIVVLDPLDVWWGLRSSSDGKRSGYPIVIFGGERGDVPLEDGSAELIADMIVEEGISAVVCVSDLSKTKQRSFVTKFAERMYYRKRQERYKTPVHVLLDEADTFCPQRVMRDTAQMVGAIDQIVRRGRNRGIGVTIISQRAAVVNKDILTQCETLFCLRTKGVQDRKAIELWIDEKGDEDAKDMFLETVTRLKNGEAWVWSPGFLDKLTQIKIRKRTTFDSSFTPKPGMKRRCGPKRMADINLSDIRSRMTDVIERRKEEDPRELKAQVAQLKKELRLANNLKTGAEQHYREKLAHAYPSQEKLDEAVAAAIQKRDEQWKGTLGKVRTRIDNMVGKITLVVEEMPSILAIESPVCMKKVAKKGVFEKTPQMSDAQAARLAHVATQDLIADREGEDTSLTRAEMAMLKVIAAKYPDTLTRPQLSILSGYRIRSSSFKNALSTLRTKGYILGGLRDVPITTTAHGNEAAGVVDPLPKGAELRKHWSRRLTKAESTIFEFACDQFPGAVSREEISEGAGYSVSSSSFKNALSALRTLQLITGGLRGEPVQASENLFD